WCLWNSSFVILLINFSVPLDLYFQRLGQRIHNGKAHTVQPAGNLIRSLVELSTGMEFSENHFCGGYFFRWMHINRNTAAVIDYRNTIVDVNCDFDLIAMTGQSFINGVVDDFIYEMV